jgi:uncharacterized low-complexity protein
MSKLSKLNALAATLVAGTVVAAAAQAGNPFSASDLAAGYQVAGHAEGHAEGKCGEGNKADEGKCGAKDDKAGEGKCGAKDDKAGEGKCGEGKCGEGKCGGAG